MYICMYVERKLSPLRYRDRKRRKRNSLFCRRERGTLSSRWEWTVQDSPEAAPEFSKSTTADLQVLKCGSCQLKQAKFNKHTHAHTNQKEEVIKYKYMPKLQGFSDVAFSLVTSMPNGIFVGYSLTLV